MKQTRGTRREQGLYAVEELAARIRAGESFFLAGDEAALRRLPAGAWAAGTTPYFMAESGGAMDRERVFATPMPAEALSVNIRVHDGESLFDVYREAPANGFSLIVMPAGSRTHSSFALNALRYDAFASRPLAGWVAGVALEELGRATAKVFDGRDRRCHEDAAIVMHVALPRGRTAAVGMVNVFEPGGGECLEFLEDGFAASEALVDGVRRPLGEYLRSRSPDGERPLVADLDGAMINTSIQGLDASSDEARFYAPVFKGVRYRLARPVEDTAGALAAAAGRAPPDAVYSCNCILNYVHGRLEGKSLGGHRGAFTFGEIAYQLLNQTMVYLTVADAPLSDRLRAHAPLQRQYQFLESIIDAVPCPLFFKDVHGRYLGCNRAYEEFVGRPRRAIIGKKVHDLLPRELADEQTRVDASIYRDGAAFEAELDLRDATGRERRILMRKAPFLTAEGAVGGLIGSLLDVSEIRDAQQQLLQAHKMAAVGRLAGGVAHEINNPLTVILGFAQAVAANMKGVEGLEGPLRSIEREALRCKNIVQDLLVFSRSSAGSRFAPTQLEKVAEASVCLLAPRARLDGVELVLAVDGACTVNGNANHLQQVLMNLAGNALDAVPAGGRVELRVGPAAEPGRVILTVRDTGAGMTEEVRARIFEPFYTTKPVGKGTGLGLALVFEIVQKHGGAISVASEPGKGSTFTVTLPAAEAAATA